MSGARGHLAEFSETDVGNSVSMQFRILLACLSSKYTIRNINLRVDITEAKSFFLSRNFRENFDKIAKKSQNIFVRI